MKTTALIPRTFLSLITILICGTGVIQARMQRQNIYIFDCTGSMKNPNQIWEPAKRALDGTLSSHSDGDARIVVVPFGDTAYNLFSFLGSDYQKHKDDIFKAFEENISKARYTNITDALQTALQQCDASCMTNIYLMTDGNPSGQDSKERVAAFINNWCKDNHNNKRLFYVVFSNTAKVPEIMEAVNVCPDAFSVECVDGKIPQLFDIGNVVNANIEELNRNYYLDSGIPDNMAVKAVSYDPFFDVRVVGGKSCNYRIGLQFVPRGNTEAAALHNALHGKSDAEGIYHFQIRVESADPTSRIANPVVHVNMSDHIQTSLTLGNGDDELEAGNATWHDSFLWSKASPNGVSEIDLKPQFRNATSDTRYRVRLRTADGEKQDYKCYYNGKELASEESFDIVPGKPAVLRIEYDTDAKTGKRCFVMEDCGSGNLDLVNGRPYDDDQGMRIRSKYSVHQNSLKTLFEILGCAILGLLLLWFLVLRKKLFRPIKAKQIILTGPDGFFQIKKIKGARKVVLTSRSRAQNIFSKWFTGKIVYAKGDIFTPEIDIVAGAKKKVKLRASQGWEYYPSSVVAPFESADLIKGSLKAKIEVQ